MFVAKTNSTNTLLKELIAKGEWPEGEKYLYAGYQTAGRGQTGNGWESEEGKNLLCSILLPPRRNLFGLNVAVSVAVYRTVITILQRSGPTAKWSYSEAVTIKWPNDIYWKDQKVAGILIENAIIGNEVKYSIAGIGVNVNQSEFKSDAPNPISLKQIYGTDFVVDELMHDLYAEVQRTLETDVWDEYKAHLYRREGYWPFVEREVSTAPTMNAGKETEGIFMARIVDVLPTGEIVLQDQQEKKRIYHFKQIRYVI